MEFNKAFMAGLEREVRAEVDALHRRINQLCDEMRTALDAHVRGDFRDLGGYEFSLTVTKRDSGITAHTAPPTTDWLADVVRKRIAKIMKEAQS